MNDLKRLSCVLFAIIFVTLLLFVNIRAQDVTSTPLPTMWGPPIGAFPVDLYCEYINSISKGPTWGDITIGVSKVADLKQYVATIYDYEIYEYSDFILFTKKGKLSKKDGIPDLIDACLDVDTHTITALQVLVNRLMLIQDLIAAYGVPDVVTWGDSFTTRTALWFDKGIAVGFSILKENSITNYGQIYLIVYFPHQSQNGFEERWPYNQTNLENPPEGDNVYQPTPSKEQNPFNFQSMVATITAQPSRTPTPTFAPYTPSPTATP